MDYEARLDQLRADHESRRRAYSRAVQGLIAVGVAAAVASWIAVASGHVSLPPVFAVAGLIPAYFLLRRMRRIQQCSRELRMRCEFYERGLARRNHTWMDHAETGAEYADTAHPYAGDLDLFGRGSLFQLLSIARTGLGRDNLARWMKELGSREEAEARELGVEELRERTDLRESMASAGAQSWSSCSSESFSRWLDAPPRRFPYWASPAALALALGIPAFIILLATRTIPPGSLVLFAPVWLALAGGFSLKFRKDVNAVTEDIGMPSVELSILSDMMRILEREEFQSPRLRSLSGGVRRGAGGHVGRLRKMVARFEFGRTHFEPVARFFLLWDAQFAIAIERWRQRHEQAMKIWLRAIGEFECFNAIAAYAFEHPADVAAQFIPGAVFEAIGLGHPLLEEQVCVRNDVSLGGDTRLWIVSGSNMSGKSTLLRACGLAIVLASMGAPVRAQEFRVSDFALAAAIGTQDSLLDGKSKFFAEVERLKRMIDLASDARPLLFLVDEMLAGTNSGDRRTASEAVVHALLERGSVGMITTHDLALTQVANGARALNVHFADSADSGGLDFDYRLRPGVIEKSNALAIVRMLGIPLR